MAAKENNLSVSHSIDEQTATQKQKRAFKTKSISK
jgi:hypothetical protein